MSNKKLGKNMHWLPKAKGGLVTIGQILHHEYGKSTPHSQHYGKLLMLFRVILFLHTRISHH